MTHVYCDGRVFRQRFRKASFYLRTGLTLVIGVPIVLGILFMFLPALTNTALFIIWALSLPIMLVTVILYGISMLSTQIMRVATLSQLDVAATAISKSEDKDRERLLDALANIIADPRVPQRLRVAEQGEPLSREEIERLIQDAERKLEMGWL